MSKSRTYVAKVRKDDRIRFKIGDNQVVELHVSRVGKTSTRVACIMDETVAFHHEKSQKQA
jgi:hypothetical protein